MDTETYEQMMKDSDMIFTAVSSGDFDDFKQAERVVVMGYVMDREISRAGISHALKRLERYYATRPLPAATAFQATIVRPE